MIFSIFVINKSQIKHERKIDMKNRILSIILVMAMVLSMTASLGVSAAEIETAGGASAKEAVKVDLNTKYVVDVDATLVADYFSFSADDDGFYEVIGIANKDLYKIEILSAAERVLASGTFYRDENVLGEKLQGGEEYLIRITYNGYGKPEENDRYFFEINYKRDDIGDKIEEAKELSLGRKIDTELEGADDVDWFTYTNDSSESKTVTIAFANNTGSGKWYYFCNESEDEIEIVGYNGWENTKGYTREVDITLESGQQVFLKIWFEHENRYVIGDNEYYVKVTEKQCEHKKTSRNNKVTEYEEIRGDENYHYIIKYYDEICDECKEVVKKRVQESKYTERHNFSGSYCTSCDYEKAEEPVKDESTYTPPTTTSTTPSYSEDSLDNNNDYSDIFEDVRFTDGAQININYKIDVIVLINLGILAGYPDGSIRPKNTLTRAEAAKLIYILNVGEDDNGTGYANANYFNDVDANAKWAKGYINYCYQKGIVSGIGKGKFDPNGKLKYAEFAKMLAVSLGCNADKEGFKGSNWMANVVARSIDAGLFDGWAGDPSGAASREVICKFIVNALRAPVYRYDDQGNGSQIADWWTGEYNITLGEELGIISDTEIWEEYDRLTD